MVYQIIGLFDGDIRSRHVAEGHMAVQDSWAGKLFHSAAKGIVKHPRRCHASFRLYAKAVHLLAATVVPVDPVEEHPPHLARRRQSLPRPRLLRAAAALVGLPRQRHVHEPQWPLECRERHRVGEGVLGKECGVLAALRVREAP